MSEYQYYEFQAIDRLLTEREIPARVLSRETARRYCVSDAASARAKGDHVVLELRSEDEEAGEWIDGENGTLASLLPLRAELAGGDLQPRPAWLGCARNTRRGRASPMDSRRRD